MGSEEYYDSLDESRSNSCLTPESESSSLNDEGEVIPYYNLNVNRSEIELDKKNSSKTIVYSKIKRLKRMQIRNAESKSYLDIFYDRKGIKKMDLMSSEATATTSRSFTTCDDFDMPSLHFNSDKGSTASYVSTCNNLALSASSLDSNFQSVSARKGRFKSNKKTVKPAKTKLTKYPELGRLGPDIPHDKLELYRRRQQYGKKVNQANRIRAIERRTLENLKQEIKMSQNAS